MSTTPDQLPKLPRLMPLMDWARERFAGSPPSDRTLYEMCRDGRIPAKRFGGRGEWWVEVDKEINQTGNDLVDRVLNRG